MPAQWTGAVVGKMHTGGITGIELAKQLGVTPEYVSMVLNGKKEPRAAEAKFNAALDALLAEREEVGA